MSSRGYANDSGRVDWDNMTSGMQPDFSHLSSIGSNTPSGRTSSSRSGRTSSSRSGRTSSSSSGRTLSSRSGRTSSSRSGSNNNMRICYTGKFLTDGSISKHSTGTYTKKQFMKLASNKFNEPGPEPMPQPEFGNEYRTHRDFDTLLEHFKFDDRNNIVTSLCSEKKHGDVAAGLPSCKECEDYMKDNGGPDLYTAQAREDARARSSRRRARRSRRRREAEGIRRARSSARRGRPGAREELARRLTRRARRATRRRS